MNRLVTADSADPRIAAELERIGRAAAAFDAEAKASAQREELPSLSCDVAAALRAFAERVERLPAHDRRNPHLFTEAKSDLAADLISLADDLTARRDALRPARFRPSRPRRPVTMLVTPSHHENSNG